MYRKNLFNTLETKLVIIAKTKRQSVISFKSVIHTDTVEAHRTDRSINYIYIQTTTNAENKFNGGI
jgi:hypothetical protein